MLPGTFGCEIAPVPRWKLEVGAAMEPMVKRREGNFRLLLCSCEARELL